MRQLPAQHVAVACEAAQAEIDQDHYVRSAPGHSTNPLDGHKFYIRLKVAYALAVLNQHPWSIRDEDWELAGIVMQVSDATRQAMWDSMNTRDRKRLEKAGKQDSIRKVAAEVAEDDERLARQVVVLRKGLGRNPDGMTRSDLRKCLDSRWREDYFDKALAQLAESGGVRQDGETLYPRVEG